MKELSREERLGGATKEKGVRETAGKKIERERLGFWQKSFERKKGRKWLLKEGGEQRQNERAKGHIKWFNDQKGPGFITPTDDGKSLFVHHSGIKAGSGGFRSLGKYEIVKFEVEQGGDGHTKAIDITDPDEGPVQGGNEQRTEEKKATNKLKRK
nr:glycine-rich protein 2-like [Coffea arabica]